MNVDDIKGDKIPTDFSKLDMLDWIFEKQKHLSHKYLPIEQSNGLRWTLDVPVNLDDRFGQAQLKDMFWRVTEELTEAVDARRRHKDLPQHALEELADALHFLVEAYIISDMYPALIFAIVTGRENSPSERMSALTVGSWGLGFTATCYEAIHSVGCASNCLKQRPWKQTHQLVDKKAYRTHLAQAIVPLLHAFKLYGLTSDQIFAMYWKKSEVNKFRIRSHY